MEELAQSGHRTEVREVEPGLLGIGVQPSDVGVGQRGLVVCTPEGNLLWDPPVYVDEAAIDAVREAGGLAAVSSSHPHMYGAIVEWSRAFDAEILLPEADRHWLMRPDPAVRLWAGTHESLPGVTLVQCGGHFPGSAVLHWAAGADGGGALFVGDTIFVTPGADRVSFIWSAPNRLPLPERAVRDLVASLEPYEYESRARSPLGGLELGANEGGAGAESLKLGKGAVAREVLHTAVRCGHEPLRGHVGQRRSDARGDGVRALDVRVPEVEDAEHDHLRAELG
jgi:glyoxylase-like metal-dependent hydrolase (beta-lactamase superfamily II)